MELAASPPSPPPLPSPPLLTQGRVTLIPKDSTRISTTVHNSPTPATITGISTSDAEVLLEVLNQRQRRGLTTTPSPASDPPGSAASSPLSTSSDSPLGPIFQGGPPAPSAPDSDDELTVPAPRIQIRPTVLLGESESPSSGAFPGLSSVRRPPAALPTRPTADDRRKLSQATEHMPRPASPTRRAQHQPPKSKVPKKKSKALGAAPPPAAPLDRPVSRPLPRTPTGDAGRKSELVRKQMDSPAPASGKHKKQKSLQPAAGSTSRTTPPPPPPLSPIPSEERLYSDSDTSDFSASTPTPQHPQDKGKGTAEPSWKPARSPEPSWKTRLPSEYTDAHLRPDNERVIRCPPINCFEQMPFPFDQGQELNAYMHNMNWPVYHQSKKGSNRHIADLKRNYNRAYIFMRYKHAGVLNDPLPFPDARPPPKH